MDEEVSSWKSVLSGVPQGSELGPILFLVYIDDLEEGVAGNILKFADDTKLFRKTKEIGDKQTLQDDIDDLGVVHNCHHYHERTQRTLGGRGSRATVRFFKCRLQ